MYFLTNMIATSIMGLALLMSSVYGFHLSLSNPRFGWKGTSSFSYCDSRLSGLLQDRKLGVGVSTTVLNIHVEKRLEELGIILPAASAPRANYDICCYTPGPTHDKEIMYLSGHLPIANDGTIMTGCVGPETGGRTVEEGKRAARLAALNIVSTLKDQLGDLDRVEQVVKVFGIVNSHTDFKEQHLVMDGCSDAIMEVFGKESGYHSRSAIGTNTLPLDITVEVEAIVRIKPEK